MNHDWTKPLYLKPFVHGRFGQTFLGGYVWSCANRHLLLEKNGHMILLNDRLYQELLEQNPDEDLWVKLLQRNFASLEGQAELCGNHSNIIRPTFFIIDLTDRCNMGCVYCLRDGNTVENPRMISEQMIQKICDYIADNCKDAHIDHIMVQPWGGEPLLEKQKIYSIQKELMRQGIDARLTIETNGLLLDEQTIQELYERKISVSVSIDGFQSLHDRQRVTAGGGPTHAKVEAAIQKLQNIYGDHISIIATVTRHSIPHLEQMLDYFAKDLHLKNIKINYVHKSSFQENDRLCLSPEEIGQSAVRIFDRLIGLLEEGFCICEYNLWVRTMNLLTGKPLDLCSSRGCSGGRRMIAFDVNGDIFPCDVTDYPEEKMGSIREHPNLHRLIGESLARLDYFKEKTSEECTACPWQRYCKGGCTVHTKCAGALPGQIDQIECAVNRALYPRIIELILEKPGIVNRLADSWILEVP